MDSWTPVDPAHEEHRRGRYSWVLHASPEGSFTAVERRVAGVGRSVLLWLALWCFAVLTIGLAVANPDVYWLALPGFAAAVLPSLARARLAGRLGPDWRRRWISAVEFAGLPADSQALAEQLVTDLHGLWSSRAAREGWVGAGPLHTAYRATWQALLRLRDTVDLRAVLRESTGFDELRELTEVRAAELAAVESSVAEVARRLRDAHRKVRELDAVLAAERERRERDRRAEELRARLAGDVLPATAAAAGLSGTGQDALDAIHADLDGALEVLGPGTIGEPRSPS